MTSSQQVYEVRPRRNRHGFDLMSDVLPFGRLVVMTFETHWNYYRQRRQRSSFVDAAFTASCFLLAAARQLPHPAPVQ